MATAPNRPCERLLIQVFERAAPIGHARDVHALLVDHRYPAWRWRESHSVIVAIMCGGF